MGKQQNLSTLRVAAIQVESKLGCIEANHAHAAPFIEQAARDGAKLIILPELFAGGYMPNQDVWNSAEAEGGPTVRWLKKMSGELGIYLGAGLAETDGKDFYNVFVLTDPDGKVAGRAQKANAESYCFKRGKGSHIIETAIGKLGVGICADNHRTSFLKLMHTNCIDMMLMPHAWPTPYRQSGIVSGDDLENAGKKVEMLAELYARSLGVPVIFVNQTGPMGPMAGFFGKLMKPELFRLQGGSRIVDSDGKLKTYMGSREGVLVADVTLDPARKCYIEPKNYGGWLHPGSVLVRKVIFPVEGFIGTISYSLHMKRRRGKAGKCSTSR